MKHIEQIQPEYAADDMTALLLSDATATAALTALLHDWTGCDIPQTDTTPQSEVDELVPLAVSILRRHWQTPLTALGDGTTPMSLADLLRRLIGDRVQGNEAWCIPPVHDNIPAAVAALRERKIGGVPELPDGLSLPRLLCDSSIANTITELIDDNIGWVMDKTPTLPSTLTKLVLGCKKATKTTNIPAGVKRVEFPYLEEYNRGVLLYCDGSDGVEFPKLRTITANDSNAPTINLTGATKLSMPSLINVQSIGNTTFCQGAMLEEIEWPSFIGYGPTTWGGWATLIGGCPNLKKVVFGKLQYSLKQNNANTSILSLGENCTHLEFGQGTNVSLLLDTWNPTDKGSLFLSNFRLYIADRLSDNGSGKTLTLSQEVRDAIHSAGIDTIITNKGWTISPVPTQQ